MLEFNNTACEYDRSKTIADMFEELVQTIPDHTAVVFKDKKYTYRELVRSATDWKIYASQGIGSEDVVSILIPRCEYMAIAPMGVIKAGAALPASGSNLSQGPPDVHDGGFLCKASHC